MNDPNSPVPMITSKEEPQRGTTPRVPSSSISWERTIELDQTGVITDASRSIIRQLREQLPELQPNSPLHVRFDDAYLDRFVKARKGQFADVLIMVRNHIAWYKDFDVPHILEFDFAELEQFRTVYPHGYHGVDKIGRPVYIERYSKLNADFLHKITNLERISKYWVQGYEKLLYERLPACGKGQSCVILDLNGVKLSMFDHRSREFLRTVSKISSDNYPETLGTMFIVNVPSFFSILYSVAKPLIAPETKKKIHVVNAKHVKEELLKYIDAHQLPKFLGGECQCDPAGGHEDHGCLSSDKGPWRARASVEEFVSCRDPLEICESRSFVTVNSFAPSQTQPERKKRSWWRWLICGRSS